ncbi:MAG: S1C family serine protease [Clostridium sp.]
MYEEDRENREDRDQEIERTEIMDDVDEQETQTSSSRSQENGKSGSSQNVNWTTPNRSSERTSSERKTQWQESKQQNNRPEHGYRNEYRETVQAPRKKNSWARKAAGITAAAVLFGTVAGGVMTGVNYVGARLTGLADITATAPAETEGTTTAQVPETSAASNNGSTTAVSTVTDVSSIAEKAMPSLVAINDTMTVEQNNFFGMPQTYQAQSSGSGIIVGQNDTELLIATNNHVVSGATDMKVTFTDSTQVAAAVKGTDSATDLAIIAVKLSDIPSDTMSKIKVATLGNSDNVKVGQQVIAIGNALGYGQSLTVGYISALDREITDENGIQHTYIQTDAAINPGNSGGALLDLNGNVIGINAAKNASTEVEGMGFAIPISKAQEILNNLMTKKTREAVDESAQGYLGIQGTNIDANASKEYGMPVGIYVYKIVEGGAAANSDLKEKDIITKFDGQSVTNMEELKQMLTYYEGGSTVSLTVQSLVNGSYVEHEVQITLGTKPASNS